MCVNIVIIINFIIIVIIIMKVVDRDEVDDDDDMPRPVWLYSPISLESMKPQAYRKS